MPLLHVALQEGFENDTVAVLLDGDEIYRKSNVSTRLQIGRADAVEIEAPAGQANVDVKVPSRNCSQSIQVDLSQATYLGISFSQEGEISYRTQSQPFGYV